MKILFVAMPFSVHAARWIRQLEGIGWDVHLFPATGQRCHAGLSGVHVHDHICSTPQRHIRVNVNWPVHRRGIDRLRRLCHRVVNVFPDRAARLASVIRRIKPDIVHSLEMQHASYLTLAAKQRLGSSFPPWVVQNWGSDIYLFRHFPEHAKRIRDVLAECDYYDCECNRDIELGREFGYGGPELPVLPNGGGYDVDAAEKLKQFGQSSDRRVILLKGYQGWAGRALVGLSALERVADLLKGYRLKIYSSMTEDVHIAARLFEERTCIETEIVPRTSHEDMLRLHGEARISIGLSISDAISTSLLEAMLMGAFPIQSDTSAATEWIENGRSGFIVPPEDPDVVAEALRRALTDSALVDAAAAINAATARRRLDGTNIRQQVVEMYKEIVKMS